ncbi:MAG: glycosyltransferase, partial [Candidatus Undinarchaeales archaeon]|nr:glycosyltransferase [Candidatus Undinarchaeales archaeon]
ALIDKQVGKIEKVGALVLERDAKIKELEAWVQERDTLIDRLENSPQIAFQNKEIDALIAEKNAIIKDREARLDGLEDTITVRSLRRFQRLERVILPPGSRRWYLYSSLFHQMRGALLKPKETSSEKAPEEPHELMQKYPMHESKVADIICFPIIDWYFRYQRPQQLLSRFAQNGYRVFYLTVELEPLKKEYVVREIAENIIEVHLSVLSPFNVYHDTLTEDQIESLLSSLDHVRRDFGIDAALSIVDFPSWQPLAFRLKDIHGWKILYDCMDEHTGFSNVDESIIREEMALIRSSDLVVPTSAHLQRKVETERDDAVLIPNAGDYEHFGRALKKEPPFDIKGPVIGYYGAIAEWFDNELVEYLANERPTWSFVLIGHTFGSDIGRLESLPNVQFLGEKSYAELPNYLCGFDVCIIPFKLTPLIEATHPVKFYEYLAAGKPVVSSRLTELEPFKDLCYLADDKDDFLKKVERALDEDGQELKDKRMAFAKKHTWDERFAMLESHIKRLFIPRGA